jgi:hypothetical protein
MSTAASTRDEPLANGALYLDDVMGHAGGNSAESCRSEAFPFQRASWGFKELGFTFLRLMIQLKSIG